MKKLTAFLFFLLCIPCLAGCVNTSPQQEVPEDFFFTIRWNTYGTSFYNSQTGTLVKSTDATCPEEYTAEYLLSPEELEYIYNLIRKMDPTTYPELYQPYKQELLSEPPHPIILTVFADGSEKQIQVENAAYTSLQNTTGKGEAFLSACGEIITLLTTSEEWLSLPDYERSYE